MKIKIKVKQVKTGAIWDEDYEIDNGKDHVQFAENLVDRFNDTLRPNESARELLGVEVVESSSNVIHDHNWEKQNMITIIKDGKNFDVMKCERCGITGKRYGIGGISRDSKFKAQAYDKCETALAQMEKNKQRGRKRQ